MRARLGAAALGALALLVAAGCGGEYASPEGTVRAWLDALEARDSARVAEAFTPRTRELVAEVEDLSRKAQPASGHPAITVEDWCHAFCGASVESSTVHGDSATVTVRIADDVNELPLLHQDDAWRIDLSQRLEPAVQMLRLSLQQAAGVGALPADTAGVGGGGRVSEPDSTEGDFPTSGS